MTGIRIFTNLDLPLWHRRDLPARMILRRLRAPLAAQEARSHELSAALAAHSSAGVTLAAAAAAAAAAALLVGVAMLR